MLAPLERNKTLSLKAYDRLIEEIRSMPAGSNKLQSEEDIAHNFGISRATVREAIKYLMMEGIVTVVQGKGIFAHPSVLELRNRIDIRSDFLRMLQSSYDEVSLDIKHLGTGAPTEVCKQYLGDDITEVLRMCWIYSSHGTRLIYGQFELPVECVKEMPAADFWVTGLPEFGRKYLYAPVAHCSMFIKSGFDKQAAKVFGVSEDIPMSCWQERIVDINDRFVGFCEFFMHPTEMVMSVVSNFNTNEF